MRRSGGMIFEDSSSEKEEEEDDKDLDMVLMPILHEDWWRPRQGWQFARVCINRNRAERHDRIMRDYFNPSAIYTDKAIPVAVLVQKDLFLAIIKAVEHHDYLFKLRRSASGEMSACLVIRCVVAVSVLAYGCSDNAIDDYVRIGQDTILETVRRFCKV
jgi:hypothetical protein